MEKAKDLGYVLFFERLERKCEEKKIKRKSRSKEIVKNKKKNRFKVNKLYNKTRITTKDKNWNVENIRFI